MKFAIHALILGVIVSCATVSRPDLPKMKGYEAKQDKLLGFIPMPVRYEKIPTATERTQAKLAAPANWILWVCIPVAVVAFAASLVLQNPSLTRKLASIALIAFLAAVLAGVWLLMTMSVIVFAACAVAVGGYAYFKFEGKGLKLHKESEQ